MNNTGILILAAGSSSRFGSPKQLIRFNGKTLLHHVIDEAKNAQPIAVVVVTGANTSTISSSIEDSTIKLVYNKDWEKGMASGIVAGVNAIKDMDNSIEKIIIAVCDQPFVSTALFTQLDQAQQETGKSIVASAYGNTMGTPVLFTRRYFDELIGLKGDTGAKKVLKEHSEEVTTIEFPKGIIDIDTQEDLDRLRDDML